LAPKCITRLALFPLKVALLFLTFILFAFAAHAQSAFGYQPNLFSSIRNLPENKRVEEARTLYKARCRKMAEGDAMKSLDDLTAIAKAQTDLPLECAVFDMRADYYSVNRGFNDISNEYHDKAILFADEHRLPLETAIYMHRKAVYLLIYKQNISACRYFLFAQEKFREVGFSKVPDMGTYFLQIADFYYSIGDYDNARENLKQALRYTHPSARGQITLLNTIGLTYRNSGDFAIAMPYFQRSLQLAKTTRDSAWIGITTGNIGSIYFLQKRYDKALPLIKADYETSIKYNQYLNAAIAMLRLIRINIDKGITDEAGRQLIIADDLLSKANEDVLRYRVDYYDLKALLNEKLGRIAESYLFNKKYNTAKDSMEGRDNLAAVEQVRLQWEMDKNKDQLTKLKSNAAIGAYKRNTVIVVLLLLMVIGILIYNRQRLKTKKNQELLASEKLRLD
jgi:tetratricopeptide (TPR) repeat protein